MSHAFVSNFTVNFVILDRVSPKKNNVLSAAILIIQGLQLTNAIYIVTFVRHGESEANYDNLFTGWYDSTLTEKGVQQAIRAGQYLQENNRTIDIAFTSLLSRAINTAEIICNSLNETKPIPIHQNWALNERHYGALTGVEKKLSNWSRTFDTFPPTIDENNRLYDAIQRDPRYKDVFTDEFKVPQHESIESMFERVLPFWNAFIVPEIKANKNVLIVSHGNVLRGFIKHFEHLSNDDAMNLHIPNSVPFVYELDENLKPIGSLQHLY